jgi:hypothetical protein
MKTVTMIHLPMVVTAKEGSRIRLPLERTGAKAIKMPTAKESRNGALSSARLAAGGFASATGCSFSAFTAATIWRTKSVILMAKGRPIMQ